MIPVIKTDSDEAAIAKAAAILKGGGVIAYPTETFYGLGADVRNERALEKLYTIKGRGFNKPISIIIGSRDDLKWFAREITPAAEILMARFWPGGVTLLFQAAHGLSERLTAGTGKIGIRLSSTPVATLLAQNLSGAITATSANRSGEGECVSAREVISSLGETVDAVIDGGRTAGGTGSTIVDTTVDPPAVIREGIVPSSEIYRWIRGVQGS
ncbi:MAG: L-threonylcarbamoyladenylate synthase [Syntrophales bacterium]|nr:L-threonylcarbamoyladenylate synthase [Syntrophales bacterium]